MAITIPLRRVVLYLVYGCMLTMVLLYVRFPKEKAEEFVDRSLQNAFPGLEFTFGPAAYTPPFTLEFKHLLISRKDDGSPLMMLENFQLRPRFRRPGMSYDVTASLQGGSVQSNFDVFLTDKMFEFSEVIIEGVNIDGLEPLKSSVDREISGQLQIYGRFMGSWVEDGKAAGDGHFKLENGQTTLKQPILSLRKLEIKKVEADFTFAEDNVQFSDGNMLTDGFAAGFSGKVLAVGELSVWRLGLNGNLTLDKDFLRKQPRILRVVKRLQKQYRNDEIPFYLKGTARNPRFAFGNG